MGKAKGNGKGGAKPAKKTPANGNKKKRQLQEAQRSSPRLTKKKATEDDEEYVEPPVDDDDVDAQDSDGDVVESETERLKQELLKEQIKNQKLMNQMALSSQIHQHQVKSGRKSSANASHYSSYNPQNMTATQKAICKSFKNYTWRAYKFMSSKTLKKVATAAAIDFKKVEFMLTGDDDADARKYLVPSFCFLNLSL